MKSLLLLFYRNTKVLTVSDIILRGKRWRWMKKSNHNSINLKYGWRILWEIEMIAVQKIISLKLCVEKEFLSSRLLRK